MRNRFVQGEHIVVDDRTGEEIYASEAVTEWNGAVVHRDDAEERHPQDFIRGRIDRQRADGPVRPEPTPVFGGPLATELIVAAAAGDTSLTVISTARLSEGDYVRVMLANQEMFRALVQTVSDATTLVIFPALPGSASVGSQVIAEVLATADIG